MKDKAIVFDLDGTLADLYGQDDWLNKLLSSDDSPYKNAEPMYDMNELRQILIVLKSVGYTIQVVSWLCGGKPTKEYNKRVTKAKRNWLKKYRFPADEITIVKYGTNKAKCVKAKQAILIDDSKEVREQWDIGLTIEPDEMLLEKLKALI